MSKYTGMTKGASALAEKLNATPYGSEGIGRVLGAPADLVEAWAAGSERPDHAWCIALARALGIPSESWLTEDEAKRARLVPTEEDDADELHTMEERALKAAVLAATERLQATGGEFWNAGECRAVTTGCGKAREFRLVRRDDLLMASWHLADAENKAHGAPLAIVNDRAAEGLEVARLTPTPEQLKALGLDADVATETEGGATLALRLAWDHLRPLRKRLPDAVAGEPDAFAEERTIFGRVRDVMNLGLTAAAAEHALAGVAVQAVDAGLVTISHEGGDR